MTTLLGSLGHWSWFIVGAVLLGLEIIAPGTFLLWFGLGALATGVLALALPMSWQMQMLIFVALAIISVIIGRKIYARASVDSDDPFLNQRAARFLGQTFTLGEPLENGKGRLRIDDTYWRITGPDCPAETRVKITSADGALLTVEPVLAE